MSNAAKKSQTKEDIQRFSLSTSIEGIYEYLKVERVYKKKSTEQIIETTEFPLRKTNRAELYRIRKTPTPIFVLKDKDDLYFCRIPNNLGFCSSDLLGAHQCAAGLSCARLSAASDDNGGCAKVRNKARFIELYPWILLGYETYHTKLDTFQVSICEHYQDDNNRKKPDNARELKKGLADFMFDGNRDFVSKYAKSKKRGGKKEE